ncbi:hypothetical protein [Streptomyces longhuiensis]|uniref:hypothetical protein n=1 Tax=Streptomyces longhuiensis TaxID=2880933 RepID=UPI001D0B5C5C|nr:hypothetical protein [Streptomyces longhuiensis]UDM00047.1 hypothetical protein LGI35_18060 [Streptomyces longhuiensis]
MPTDRPPLSPCRRNDRHDEHVYEVYGRPFQCLGYTPRTEAELLAELAPLAALVAEKLRTVPVRLIGRGGADDLISELTLAAALYCAKHVLPAGPPPAPDPAETDEERADREETERAHAHGDHTYCGATCETEFPTELLRNTILAKGYPGTAGMLDEMLRRARAEAAAAPSAPASQTVRRERYAAAIRETDGWVLDDGQHMIAAVMAVADAEHAELRRERDLAIAHDRQPYPTAWAYEQACAALRRKTDTIERVRAVLETEAVVDRSALEYRGLITTALMADESQQAHAFVPDAPRAPGLCATCGDSRAWHRGVTDEEQQP